MEELEIMVYIQRMFYCLITFLGFTFKTLWEVTYMVFQFKNKWMQKHYVGGNKRDPKLKKQNKTNQNTASCAALENWIKSKSTFKSVNFGVWIQNVHQYYLCRWLLRDVQHFQNPCVSLIRKFGTLSSVVTVLSSAGCFFLFSCVIVHLCITKSHRTHISGWVSLHFCFSRDRSSNPLDFSSIL